MVIKISKPSKMKVTGKRVGCWSLGARISCPGSVNDDGSVVDVCKMCYATKNMYNFPVVKAARATNREDYKKDDWVDRMVKEVSKYDYFRWFDSGDIETPELAEKIGKVIARTTKTQHWLPTRSDKIPAILNALPFKPLNRQHVSVNNAILKAHTSTAYTAKYPNVALRPSADHIGLNNQERPGVNSYVIETKDLFECKKQGIYLCPVTSPGSTQKSCDTCTMCYTDAPVAYLVH